MLELTSNGRPVALDPATTVQLELNSPLFDDEGAKGDYSFSFPVPAEPNGDVYGYPELPEADAPAAVPGTLADDGQVVLTGTQRVRTATAERYTVNLVGGASALAAGLGRKLHSFALGGERRLPIYADAYGTPGIVTHANDTVAHPERYDYVFAPLLNEAPGPDAPATLINPWTHLRFGYNILPAGGTFYQPVGQELLMCPLPWLRYVLASIFTELGLRLAEPAQFLPGERGQLLMGGNAVLPAPVHRFRLADVLPDLTVVELLSRLRTAAGIVCLLNTTDRSVRTVYLDEVLAGPASVDLTHLASGRGRLERAEPQGFTLTYEVDGADALTSDLGRDFSGQRLGEPVAALADLPASLPVPLVPGLGYDVPLAELRLVIGLDTWYQSTVTWVNQASSCTLSWAPFAPNFRPFAVGGGGPERAQGLATTVMRTGTGSLAGDALDMLVPAMKQPVFRATAGADDGPARSTALRLWFWRGRQPSAADPAKTYPLVTPYNRTAAGLRVGACSFKYDGADGAYERWLKRWLQAQAAPCVLHDTLALTPEHLAQHDPATKVRIGATEYLVRKLTPTLPLTQVVPVELVRV